MKETWKFNIDLTYEHKGNCDASHALLRFVWFFMLPLVTQLAASPQKVRTWNCLKRQKRMC
jgi:hypothetical protein